MPRLAPKELKLEEREREHLEKLINRHTTEQQIALQQISFKPTTSMVR